MVKVTRHSSKTLETVGKFTKSVHKKSGKTKAKPNREEACFELN